MSNPQTTDTLAERDELPRVTLREFLKHLSQETICDDPKISAGTLRLVMQDWRDHALRLHAELNQWAATRKRPLPEPPLNGG